MTTFLFRLPRSCSARGRPDYRTAIQPHLAAGFGYAWVACLPSVARRFGQAERRRSRRLSGIGRCTARYFESPHSWWRPKNRRRVFSEPPLFTVILPGRPRMWWQIREKTPGFIRCAAAPLQPQRLLASPFESSPEPGIIYRRGLHYLIAIPTISTRWH
jgi:hypothetical protein